MIVLIIGGAFQGKTEFAKTFSMPILNKLHDLIFSKISQEFNENLKNASDALIFDEAQICCENGKCTDKNSKVEAFNNLNKCYGVEDFLENIKKLSYSNEVENFLYDTENSDICKDGEYFLQNTDKPNGCLDGENLEEHFNIINNLVIVCDDIGSGIVPIDKLQRKYREVVGRSLCRIASQADIVYKVQTGIPLKIKG